MACNGQRVGWRLFPYGEKYCPRNRQQPAEFFASATTKSRRTLRTRQYHLCKSFINGFNMYIATTQINPAENNQVRYNTYFCHAAPLAASPARSLQLGLLLHPHANFPHSDHMLYSEYLAALPYLDPGYLRLPFVLDCRKSLLADPWSTTQFREHA
jgi:hypothetical protein